MTEYEYVPKAKKRLKLEVVEIPYMKKKRIPKKSYEEKCYDAAAAAKKHILTDKKLFTAKMCAKRTNMVFNHPDFGVIKNAGQEIRKREVLYYFLFSACLVGYAFVAGLFSYFTKVPILFLTVIPSFFIFKALIKPKLRFKNLFTDVYLPLCYNCANIKNEKDVLNFEIDDKKQNWDNKSVNSKIITNSFRIHTKKELVNVEKMIVRNYITTYKMKNGMMTVGKKLATIFSGYSFETNMPKVTEQFADDDILFAIINKNTFFGTDGLYFEDGSLLTMEKMQFHSLNDKWKIYRRTDFEISPRVLRNIEKKIMMIDNEIGAFNAYITPTGVRMMISVQLNRDGLKEEFFQAQLKNPESLTYNGFFSIVKTLYIVSCMDKLVQILFGIKKAKRISEIQGQSMIARKGPDYLISNIPKTRDFSAIGEGKDKKAHKKPLFTKKGEIGIETAVGLVITVVLSSLLLFGFVKLLNDNVSDGTIQNTNSVFENSRNTTVTESTLLS